MMHLTHGLTRSALLFRDRPATIFQGRRRSWGEVHERVRRLAAGLVKLGVQPGDRVGVIALNSDRYIEIYYAVAWAGAVIVPGNTRWALPEHVHAIRDSGVEILLIGDDFLHLVAPLTAEGPLRTVIHFGEEDTPAGAISYEQLLETHEPMEDRCGRDRDLAAIFYTGGTTGRSKGVMLSHYSLVSNYLCAFATEPPMGPSLYLHSPPMFHLADASMIYGITLQGGTHVIIPYFDPRLVVEAIEQEGVTDAVLVPTMLGMMRDHVAEHGGDLGSVVRMTYGASAISESLLRQAMTLFPNARFRQAYGQTELSPCATILSSEDHLPRPDGRSYLRSAGRPAIGMEVRIVDDAMQTRPTGAVGEVAVRGPGVMLGYWNMPELTAATIVDGWVRTGDAGYMDEDGYLYLVDRVKDMIVSGGENVYSAEVENALASHGGISQCAVIGVPDAKWGERVHAIIHLKPGQARDADQIIGHCRALIAGYKCPRSVEFRDDPLPLSAAGKILKAELRKPYWEAHRRNIG